MGKLDGRVAIVTGGGQGIGRGVALVLAREGADVVVVDMNPETARRTAAEVEGLGRRALAVPTDVRRRREVEACVAAAEQAFGRIDALVNCAQIQRQQVAFEDTTDDDMDVVLGSGLMGTFYFMQACFPLLRRRGGKVINVASAAGLVGAPLLSAYAASKHAIIGLTRTAADENARKPIRINALCPSFADTPLLDQMVEQMATDKNDAHNRLSNRIPMRRVATTGEVVQAMLWLCSPDNSFMTGQAVAIDGGLTAI